MPVTPKPKERESPSLPVSPAEKLIHMLIHQGVLFEEGHALSTTIPLNCILARQRTVLPDEPLKFFRIERY
jgi:hypothetical protein